MERRFEKKALVMVENGKAKRELKDGLSVHGWKMVWKMLFTNEAQGAVLARRIQLSLLSLLSLGAIQPQVPLSVLHHVTPGWPHLTWTWADCLSRHRREDKLWASHLAFSPTRALKNALSPSSPLTPPQSTEPQARPECILPPALDWTLLKGWSNSANGRLKTTAWGFVRVSRDSV